MITQVLNDQSPYDVQPHLWNDGDNWWVYFCADNENGKRCIYKSKQQIINNWDSWAPKILVIEALEIIGGYGTILGVGEPTLTQRGDISFVVIYGDLNSQDTTDMFDCDPWFLPKKGLTTGISEYSKRINPSLKIFPNPASNKLTIYCTESKSTKVSIYNIIGQAIETIEVNVKTQIDISHLPNGIYFIQSQDDLYGNVKFIKCK